MGSKKGDDFSGDGASPGKIFVGGLARDTTIGQIFIISQLACFLKLLFLFVVLLLLLDCRCVLLDMMLDVFLQHFEKYGEVTDYVIMKDRHTGRPRGFGFITYADPSVVDTVIQDDHIIGGKQVEIKRTIPKGAAQTTGFKTKKIFVGGIPTTMKEDDLKEFFSKFGKVMEHEIIRDHATKRSRGFGFIVFDSEKVVDDLLANGKMIDMAGTQVEIKKAEPKKASNPASGPAFGSDSRTRSYDGGFGGFDDYGGYGSGGFGLPSYRSLGGYSGRLGYGGYGGATDFGRNYGALGEGSLGSYHGEPSFGYSSRFGSYAGGFGPDGLGGYVRDVGVYGNYGVSGSGTGYNSGQGPSYTGAGGLYGSRAGYGSSSRYHPYAR
ncbi:hypothetical protein K2173_028325 [Erythroxylum novogranatense]|uniref:RRM domain-containing protein n=1 Tax=Erythroxylum novogranatense TaxID=1862640 RepID=A0AAV8U5H2_9ROSI|nr:hypothetical protein K2173_028325 [Erythroxylum novogranatense]